MKPLDAALKIAIAFTGLASAYCWLKAATATAAPIEMEDTSWIGGSYSEKEANQLLADLRIQASWNRRAAALAAVTTVLALIDGLLYA